MFVIVLKDVCIFYLNVSGIDCLCRSPRRPASGDFIRSPIKDAVSRAGSSDLAKNHAVLVRSSGGLPTGSIFVWAYCSCHPSAPIQPMNRGRTARILVDRDRL